MPGQRAVATAAPRDGAEKPAYCRLRLPVSSVGWDARPSLRREQGQQRVLQGRQVAQHGVPDDLEVDAEIVVHEDVPDASRLGPGHSRVTLSKRGRHLLGRLANDLQAPDHGKVCLLIPGERRIVETLSQPARLVSVLRHVPR